MGLSSLSLHRERMTLQSQSILCNLYNTDFLKCLLWLWQRKRKCIFPSIRCYCTPSSWCMWLKTEQSTVKFFHPKDTCWHRGNKLEEIKIDRVWRSALSWPAHIYLPFCMGRECGQIVLMVRRAILSSVQVTDIWHSHNHFATWASCELVSLQTWL